MDWRPSIRLLSVALWLFPLARGNTAATIAVPPHIFLIGKSLTPGTEARLQHVRSLHPRYNVSFFDDDTGEAFLRASFSERHVETLRSLRNGAHKADFLRYCLLYHFGGFYLDLDNIPTAPLVACTPSVSSWPSSTFPPRYSSGVDLVSVLAFAPRLCNRDNNHGNKKRRATKGRRTSSNSSSSSSSSGDGSSGSGSSGSSSSGQSSSFSSSSSSSSFLCGPPRTIAARACRPCVHVHNGFLVATRPRSPLLRRLADFMMEHPAPERGSPESPTRALLYHFYVRHFYLSLLRDLRRTALEPGVVYQLAGPGRERVLLVDAVGVRRPGGGGDGGGGGGGDGMMPARGGLRGSGSGGGGGGGGGTMRESPNRTTTAAMAPGISRCMRMGVKLQEATAGMRRPWRRRARAA